MYNPEGDLVRWKHVGETQVINYYLLLIVQFVGLNIV
jgi:hypothetical protein